MHFGVVQHGVRELLRIWDLEDGVGGDRTFVQRRGHGDRLHDRPWLGGIDHGDVATGHFDDTLIVDANADHCDHLTGISVQHHSCATAGAQGGHSFQHCLLDGVLHRSIQGEHHIVARGRRDRHGAGARQRTTVAVVLANLLAVRAGQDVVVLLLDAGRTHTEIVRATDDALAHVATGHGAPNVVDRVDPVQIQCLDGRSLIVGHLASHVDERLVGHGEGLQQRLLPVWGEAEDGRQRRHGGRRIADQLGVGRDRGGRHRHGQFLAVAIEDDTTGGLQHALAGALGTARLTQTLGIGSLQHDDSGDHDAEHESRQDEHRQQPPTGLSCLEVVPDDARRSDGPLLQCPNGPAGRAMSTIHRLTDSWLDGGLTRGDATWRAVGRVARPRGNGVEMACGRVGAPAGAPGGGGRGRAGGRSSRRAL